MTTTHGAYCTTARAIVPMHDNLCDWCGEAHKITFSWEWIESEGRSKWQELREEALT